MRPSATMRRLVHSLAIVLMLGCQSDSKDPGPEPLVTGPETKPAEDDKSGGVYKGMVIGSAGTFKLILQDGVKEMRVTLDGVTRTLTSPALSNWTSGQPINSAMFASGDWQIPFSVEANGHNAHFGLASFSGHPNVSTFITKETSTGWIKIYTGTFSGTFAGTVHVLEQGSAAIVMWRQEGETISSVSFTTHTMGEFSGATNNGTVSGTIQGADCSGTWSNFGGGSGIWSAKRSL